MRFKFPPAQRIRHRRPRSSWPCLHEDVNELLFSYIDVKTIVSYVTSASPVALSSAPPVCCP